MAYLHVNKNGTELISSRKLIRGPKIEKLDKRLKRKQILSIEDQSFWNWPYESYENLGEVVILPNGSIEKLIGY